jgi:hypothetical protein
MFFRKMRFSKALSAVALGAMTLGGPISANAAETVPFYSVPLAAVQWQVIQL